MAVVPLDTDWNDLGTFKALYEVHPHDAEGNVGTAEYLSAKDNYVHAPGKHVGMIGVDNLVVVDTADALLICDNRHTEQVKDLVHRYKKRDDPVTQFHRQVHRPGDRIRCLRIRGVQDQAHDGKTRPETLPPAPPPPERALGRRERDGRDRTQR